MNRELPVQLAHPTPGWVRGLVVGGMVALVTTVFLWVWGAPPEGDPVPYPTVTYTMPGA